MASHESERMDVGVIVPTRNVVTTAEDPVREMRSLVDLGPRLEAAGFGSIWVGDSLLGRPRPEPLATLAAIAERTERIAIGTAALLPAMRHPLQLAQQAATLDLLSGGRLVLGVGSGFPNAQTERELEALGIPMGERIARCHEAVAWCRALWGAGPAPAPRYWRLDGYAVEPAPARPGGPRFWLGGDARASCERAGRRYDGWMPTSPSPERFRDGWALVRASAERSGRDPEAIEPATVLTIALDEEAERARGELREFIETYYGVALETAEDVVGCAAGTPDEVAATVAAFREAGVRSLLVRFASHDQRGAIETWSGPLLEALASRRLV